MNALHSSTNRFSHRRRAILRGVMLCLGMVFGALFVTIGSVQIFANGSPTHADKISQSTSTSTIPPTPTPLDFGDEVRQLGIEVSRTHEIAAGDMDLDGDLDVAVASEDAVLVYRNEAGSFTKTLTLKPRTHYSGRPHSVAWGDANNDGYLDLAVAVKGEPIPHLLFINESGRLTSTVSWKSGFSSRVDAHGVEWGDFNHDGWLDLAFANRFTDSTQVSNTIYLNKNMSNEGTLAFSPPIEIAEPISSSNDLALADFDGDGDLDIALARGGFNDHELGVENYLYENISTVTTSFKVHPFSQISGEFPRTSGLQDELASLTTYSLAWGDVDGDGDPDLAIGNFNRERNQVFCNISTQNEPKFTLCWQSPLVNGTEEGKYRTRDVRWGDINGDNVIDLIIGNDNDPNEIFCNVTPQGKHEGAIELKFEPCWESETEEAANDRTATVALLDGDADGDLDIIFGNGGPRGGEQPDYLYINPGDLLTTVDGQPINMDSPLIQDVKLADVNRDGFLDVALALEKTTNYHSFYIFTHTGDLSQNTPYNWSSPVFTETFTKTNSIAFSDLDADGFPDLLALGNGSAKEGEPTAIYEISAAQNSVCCTLITQTAAMMANSVAWGDVDLDGTPDLAIGTQETADSSAHNLVYRTNVSGTIDNGAVITFTRLWTSTDSMLTAQVKWGDVDNDGDLDLAVANMNQPNQVFRNNNGVLEQTPFWSSPDSSFTTDIAWGDYDADGDLDLATASGLQNRPQISHVYENLDGTLTDEPIWRSAPLPATGVAWQDFDLDGALDLILLNSSASGSVVFNHIYLNRGGVLGTDPVEWGRDDDQDGVSNRLVSYSMAWGDLDNDGDLDAFDGQNHETGHITLNDRVRRGDSLPGERLWISGVQQVGNRVDIDFELVGSTFYSNTYNGGAYSTEYRMKAYAFPQFAQSGNVDIDEVWQALTLTQTNPTVWADADGVSSTISFDPLANNILGEIDDYVVRVVALPQRRTLSAASDTSLPMQPTGYAAPAATTPPFRVSGRRVRVITNTNGTITGVKGAQVFFLSSPTEFTPYQSSRGERFQTDPEGYLQGLGTQRAGIELMALHPYINTGNYTLYHTSGRVGQDGTPLDAVTVDKTRVTTLTVSSDNQLYLFHLDVSLEWDARHEPAFLEQLKASIQRASTFLYAVTDGQMALGNVTVYQNKQKWREADVQVYVSNRYRPNADLGGIVTRPITITFSADAIGADASGVEVGANPAADLYLPNSDIYKSQTITNAIYPGQVRMPAFWNRFGEPTLDGGEDWARAFAHELGHYLLYLTDHYLQVKEPDVDDQEEQIIYPLTVEGEPCDSLMHNAYNSLHEAQLWHSDAQNCAQSVAQFIYGLSDWELLERLYGISKAQDAEGSPLVFPLGLTDVQVAPYDETITVLAEPFFVLANNQELSVFDAEAYLLRDVQTPPADSTGSYSDVIAVGAPIANQFHARGAQPGDKLCVYVRPSVDGDQQWAGCTTVSTTSNTIELHDVNWTLRNVTIDARPDGIDTKEPFTHTLSLTVTVDISQHPTDTISTVRLQVLPIYAAITSTANYTDLGIITQPLGTTGVVTFANIQLPDLAFGGYLRIWGSNGTETKGETLIPFYLGGGWGPDHIPWGPDHIPWGPNRFAWSSGTTGWNAPTRLADGRVMLFNIDHTFGPSPRYVIRQSAEVTQTELPFTPLGGAYDITVFTPTVSNETVAQSDIPTSTPTSIVFQYLERELPNRVEERRVAIFYQSHSETGWHKLPSQLDKTHNLVASTLPESHQLGQSHRYALGLQTSIALQRGWNLIGYPLRRQTTVSRLRTKLPDTVTLIVSYDAEQQQWEWEHYPPEVTCTAANDGNVLPADVPNDSLLQAMKEAARLLALRHRGCDDSPASGRYWRELFG